MDAAFERLQNALLKDAFPPEKSPGYQVKLIISMVTDTRVYMFTC